MTAEVIVPQGTDASSSIDGLHQRLEAEESHPTSEEQFVGRTDTAAVISPLLNEPQPEPITKPQKYVLPEISLVDRHIDEPRALRVAVVGAGLSGVIAGVLLPVKVPGIELTIFEKNADVVSDKSIYLKP
jgi:hypothetical protein